MTAGLSRRAFFLALAVGLSAARLRLVGEGRESVERSVPRPQVRALLELLEGRRSAEVVGATYLAETPEERHVDVLVDRLDLGPVELAPERAREWLTVRLRDDFTCGRVALVDGWILAVTEARLCALAAMV